MQLDIVHPKPSELATYELHFTVFRWNDRDVGFRLNYWCSKVVILLVVDLWVAGILVKAP